MLQLNHQLIQLGDVAQQLIHVPLYWLCISNGNDLLAGVNVHIQVELYISEGD